MSRVGRAVHAVVLGGAVIFGSFAVRCDLAAAAEPVAWFWEWTDGSRSASRVLSERADAMTSLPGLAVASSPAAPGQRVLLQIRYRGSWRTEDAAVTDRAGRARVQLNPYCATGSWCSGPATYRLVAGGRTAELRLTYQPTPTNS